MHQAAALYERHFARACNVKNQAARLQYCKMRIAMLSTFYPFRGGIAQFNASLYRELEKSHIVKAYTFTTQYPSFLFPGETQFVKQQDNADEIPAERVLSTINPISYITASGKISKFGPDILFMKYWMSFFGPSLGAVAGKLKSSGTKTITILDNVIPHEQRFFDKSFTRYFLNRNSGFVAMSEKVKRDLLSLRPDAQVVLLPHPLYNHFGAKQDRLSAREKLGLKPNLKTILFFGLIRDYKGLDLLIEAFSTLDDSYQLVIAGETYGSFEMYQKLIDRSANRDRISVFAEYISDQRVPLFFSAADVLVLPYRAATQSGVTAIAYHFDLPIIATDTGGLKELVLDSKTGLIVDRVDADSIAESILKFFNEFEPSDFEPHIAQLKKDLSWQKFSDDLIGFAKSI